MSRERGEGRVVGGPDPVEPEAERVDEVAHVPVEVRCGDTDLGAADQVRPGCGWHMWLRPYTGVMMTRT